jgi:hypothetical protein
MPPRERDRKWHEKKQGGQNGLAKRAKRYPLTEVEWVTSVDADGPNSDHIAGALCAIGEALSILVTGFAGPAGEGCVADVASTLRLDRGLVVRGDHNGTYLAPGTPSRAGYASPE